MKMKIHLKHSLAFMCVLTFCASSPAIAQSLLQEKQNAEAKAEKRKNLENRMANDRAAINAKIKEGLMENGYKLWCESYNNSYAFYKGNYFSVSYGDFYKLKNYTEDEFTLAGKYTYKNNVINWKDARGDKEFHTDTQILYRRNGNQIEEVNYCKVWNSNTSGL
jgi:hypothetical protein